MEAIKIEVAGNIARVIEKPLRITSGTVGLPVEFTFDSQWDGLSKIAVFQAGYVRKDMMVVDDATVVPMEITVKPNVRLNIGVYGVNEDGSVAIPTIWANAGQIRDGAVPGGSTGSDIGIAKKYYDEAMQAAKNADASAKKAESEAGVAETNADRAEASAKEADVARSNAQVFANDAEEAADRATEAAERAEAAAEKIQLDQEYFDTVVFSVDQSAEAAANAARDAAAAKQSAKDDADRAEDASKRTEEVAGSVGSPVSYKAQTLTKEEQAQARENIGVEVDYYFTERKEFANAKTLKAADVFALYDKIASAKNELKDNEGKFVTNEYVFSVGDYGSGLNDEVTETKPVGTVDPHVKKPTFLIMSGIHGFERTTVLSTYRFFEDLVNRKNMPAYFPEGAIFKVVPVATPWGFDKKNRLNQNGVNLNRNFDYNWIESDLGANANYSGPSAASEVETQAVTNWLNANKDATLFLDLHTSSKFHQLASLIGARDNEAVTKAKNVALRGIDKVIPFWKNKIGYGSETIFPYSSYLEGYNGEVVGVSTYYASEVLGIPSLSLECTCEWSMTTGSPLSATAIATCAEVLGNILLETYIQSVGTREDCSNADAEVCVSYEQPTDPETKVWYNPNGGVPNVQERTEANYGSVASIVGLALNEMLNNTAARYATIQDAHDGASATADGKVLAYTCGGALNIMLLDDMESAVAINITKDCTLHLNGKTLSFTAPGAYLKITTASEVTINGEVAGSEITMNIANGANEKLISATNTALNVMGGTYSMYGTYSTAAVAIRSENTGTKITATGCEIVVDASAATAKAMQAKGATALHKCRFDVDAQSSNVVAVSCSSSLTMENCYGSARSPSVSAVVSTVYISGNEATITNCHLEADGWSDADGKTIGVWAINAVNKNSIVTINGGYYWGARNGVAILGTGRINGGVFEGCQHGGAYMSGADIKAKNAIFRNVEYGGTVGWFEGKNYDGAIYCGTDSNAVNAHFDNCRFESNHRVPYGIIAKHNGTAVFLSNCAITGTFNYDLSADSGNTIHVGKNVQYESIYGDGTIDTTTYADQEFGFETKATVSHALLSVKDERGNWVGIA